MPYVPDKPERPFKNLNDFRIRGSIYGSSRATKDSNYWPCLHCHGNGKIIAPYERPCPVEGYKMADRIACPNCNGTGEGTVEKTRLVYKKAIEKYTIAKKAYDLRATVRNKALKKLSMEEKKALGIVQEPCDNKKHWR